MLTACYTSPALSFYRYLVSLSTLINAIPRIKAVLAESNVTEPPPLELPIGAESKQPWRARYDAYIASPAWAQKRLLVLQRDGYVCQSCHRATATQVHHLTYRHLGNEPLFELASICTPCHEQITEADRARRGA